MSKIKIEIMLDIDFQKYFDNVPKGLFETNDSSDKDYELNRIGKVLNSCDITAITNKIEWMTSHDYKYAEHHILIEEEISR